MKDKLQLGLEKISIQTSEERKNGKKIKEISYIIFEDFYNLLKIHGDMSYPKNFPGPLRLVDSKNKVNKRLGEMIVTVEYDEDLSTIPLFFRVNFRKDEDSVLRELFRVRPDKIEGSDGEQINNLKRLKKVRKWMRKIVRAGYKSRTVFL